MSISDATISVDVFSAVRAALVAAAIKVTDETGGATKTASIMPAYINDRKTTPQVVINPIAKSEEQYKFGKTTGRQFINVTVECFYTTSKGIEQMSDAVETAIKATTFDGMELVGITTDYGFVDPNYGHYHVKSLTFTFDRE
jgi:hypothetical protein